MPNTKPWLQELFINEAKPALDRHSGGSDEINLQEKEINQNGVVTPDEGYDGLGSVTVNLPDPPLQEKTTTINGEVTPDSEYYGLSKVVVDIADAPVMQEKTVTSNGEVTPDEGYDGLSKVTVKTESTLKKYLDISKSMKSAFSSNNSVIDLTGVIEYDDTSNVTNMDFAFAYCSKLTKVPLLNTSSVNTMEEMFENCMVLEEIPAFDTSSVTKMEGMFLNCYEISKVPYFNTSKVTNMVEMFYGCRSITTVPLFDTSNVTKMNHMFFGCQNLVTVPLFDTRKVNVIYSLFYNCTALTVVPALDVRGSTRLEAMFYNCTNLTEVGIKNIIGGDLTVGSGTSYGHLLTMDSLLNLLNETVYSTSSKTLTVGSANLAKFTGDYEYVKPTGKYLDLDDNEVTVLTNNATKIPVVWCSSTDEGAMTVADYMMSKGWNIA